MSNALAENHSFSKLAIFQIKVTFFTFKRCYHNLFSGLEKFSNKGNLNNLPLAATSESELWNKNDNAQNQILTAGKVQNLRIAAQILNGMEVPANQTFSFWKHIGNPNIGKGFVIGREVREGCIVPSIAGGMCQLSNALYDAAIKAGFEILERHKHTKVIPGSLAEHDRDATVKWNYLDLRFRANVDFKVVTDLTANKLIVKLMANSSVNEISNSRIQAPDHINDCYSCGNFDCFKPPKQPPATSQTGATVFVLDERWTEYEQYINSIATPNDIIIMPSGKHDAKYLHKFRWQIKDGPTIKTFIMPAVQRTIWRHIYAKMNRNVFASSLKLDRLIAKKIAKRIPYNATQLVVAQNLLPFLQQEGLFGGRRYNVLMTRLPLTYLHDRLNIAHKLYPQSKTLDDFRANDDIVESEILALNRAEHIITPHEEIAELFNNKVIKLKWAHSDIPAKEKIRGNKVLFPASGVARKGAFEIKRLAIELDLTLVVTGGAMEHIGFWEGVRIAAPANDLLDDIALVVYPTYVEHSPRIILKALSCNIPVITTNACGLPPQNNLTIVKTGDYDQLREAVKSALFSN
ncbi:VanW family protein [Mucilaginibacter auburnensis]|uniref:VanW like protein n=1 Tax=Mucilaginibacter auburnensis TaxID=1457233 RepID=A0A2H9VLG9_9SPHI|nr:VanW family protein [Mucilaginibacter auburnensis]PJJ79189.1 VanW like protein [Mucilaginibacter auburnensis]